MVVRALTLQSDGKMEKQMEGLNYDDLLTLKSSFECEYFVFYCAAALLYDM